MAPKTIQQLRTEKGLSEEQFGRMAGLTANDVREWERTGSIHDPVKIGTAAKALGVPWSAILLQPEWSVYAPAGKQLLLYTREMERDWQSRVRLLDQGVPTLVGGVYLLELRGNGATQAEAIADLQRQLDAAFRQAAPQQP
jgi:transcriptional regulator with XRE-family HTH domain